MQHLLARLREPEAWAAVVKANEELLADAIGAAERLERAAAERQRDDAAQGRLLSVVNGAGGCPQSMSD